MKRRAVYIQRTVSKKKSTPKIGFVKSTFGVLSFFIYLVLAMIVAYFVTN